MQEKAKLQRELEKSKAPEKKEEPVKKPPPRVPRRGKPSSDESDGTPPRKRPAPPRKVSPKPRLSSPRRRSPSPRRRSRSPRRRSPVRRPPPRKRLSSPESVGSRTPSPRRRRRSSSMTKSMKLHIGNLTRNVNKDHILEIFSVYGRVRSIDLPLDTKNYLPRGYAYVEYDQAEDAKDALRHMNGGWIDGQEITAKEVLAIESSAPTSGNRGRTFGRPRGGTGGGGGGGEGVHHHLGLTIEDREVHVAQGVQEDVHAH